MATLIDITKDMTPNAGRVAINTNLTLLNEELAKKLAVDTDGTNSITVNLSVQDYRITNAGSAIDDTDVPNLQQLKSYSNKEVTNRKIIIVPEFNQEYEVMYLDGTNSAYDVRVADLESGINYAADEADATFGYSWSMKLPFKSQFYLNQSFVNFGDDFNIYGEGRPVVEISDGTSAGSADLIGDSKLEGLTLVYDDGKELNLENVKIDNCDVFMSNISGIDPRVLTLRSVVITNSRLVADSIVFDSTTSSLVDNCIISVDFTNEESNDVNVTNRINTNLENFYDIHTGI